MKIKKVGLKIWLTSGVYATGTWKVKRNREVEAGGGKTMTRRCYNPDLKEGVSL